MTSTYKTGGARRLIFTGNVKTNLFNKYTPGSGVGALNTSVRNALKRKATLSSGQLLPNGKYDFEKKMCCQ
mgnify:CR=1 FL=1|tara:strand:- start:582 stop:794 length:213 start_codon:yes stop_codon:yes gene_type:complete